MTIVAGKITEFQGDHRWLSNFWPCRIRLPGATFRSVEHAYQALKFPPSIWPEFTELPATHSGAVAAKRLGREGAYPSHADKLQTMLRLVRLKFSLDNQGLLALLLETEVLVLEEGNRWGDRFWGICPPGSGDGLNHLGKILMRVRDEVRV